MKKPKRISLALKVNIVIMAMILTVSVLLILISENTYQKAVFRPYFRKLENAEVPATVKPLLQGFIQYFGLEDLDRARAESDRESGNIPIDNWFEAQPSLSQPSYTLFFDWVDFALDFSEFQRADDMHEIRCIAEKNGKQYMVCNSG